MTDLTAFLSGCFAGFASNLVGHPLDTIKTNLQCNKKIDIKEIIKFRGIVQSSKASILTNSLSFGTNKYLSQYCNNNFVSGSIVGFLNAILINPTEYKKIRRQLNLPIDKNIYRGLSSCICREVIGWSAYFGMYEYLKTNQSFNTVLSGSITGAVSWIITYPIDIIKTKYQSNSKLTYIQIINRTPYHQLFNGMLACVVRSIIINGIVFPVYEYCELILN